MNKELFTTVPTLRIGKIVEVSGNSIKVELDVEITELTRSVFGQVYSVGQIGSIIKIHFGRKILFAYVRMLRMQSDILAEEGKTIILPGDDKRILEADLFGQGTWSSKSQKLTFARGVETYPLPLQDAFLCLNDELESIYRAAEDLKENKHDPMVPIGNYVGGNNAVCRANIDKLFGQHCAILGSTGSGKSGTVASILHSILSHKSEGKKISPRIVIIDPHGEYAKAFGDKAKVFKAYNDASINDSKSEKLELPYWLMSADEFRALVIGKTVDEATSQNNKVYQALRYSRLVEAGYIKSFGANPVGEAPEVLIPPYTETDLLNFDRDKPIPFKLREFEIHLDCIQGRKPNDTKVEPPSNKDRQQVNSVLNKLRVLKSNPQLNFLMNEHDKNSPSLDKVISQFVEESEGKNLKIIDISGLPNEVAGPLTALIARLLFQYKLWQTRAEREKDPILFICEEAHRYVPNHGEAQYKEAQEAIRRIAKEGRKYGIGLMLVSQRPSDVEATVLSQCNSWIILRLTNSTDQEHVSKFLPDSLVGLTKMLPSLTRREAIFVGEAAALPSRIRINKLSADQLPDSADISFINGWVNEQTRPEELKKISDRWIGNNK